MPAGLVVIVTSSKCDELPSSPYSRNTYVPGSEKAAVVSGAAGLSKTTVPGPACLVQLVSTNPGESGKPSSVTTPVNKAGAGKAIVWSRPASTSGGMLPAAGMENS